MCPEILAIMNLRCLPAVPVLWISPDMRQKADFRCAHVPLTSAAEFEQGSRKHQKIVTEAERLRKA